MATHGQAKAEGWKRNHYAKRSRAMRYGRRWDARVKEMMSDLALREAVKAAAAEVRAAIEAGKAA